MDEWSAPHRHLSPLSGNQWNHKEIIHLAYDITSLLIRLPKPETGTYTQYEQYYTFNFPESTITINTSGAYPKPPVCPDTNIVYRKNLHPGFSSLKSRKNVYFLAYPNRSFGRVSKTAIAPETVAVSKSDLY